MAASEQISMGLYPRNHDKIGLEDAQTLIRVMCHKKDRQASKFLKRLYQLPASSGDFSASLICLHGILMLYDVQIVTVACKLTFISKDGNCKCLYCNTLVVQMHLYKGN